METNVNYLNAYVEQLKKQRWVYLIIGFFLGSLFSCGGLFTVALLFGNATP